MRREDREVKEFDAILKIVAACKVCRLALWDEEGPYIVPLNFGYEVKGGRLTLYFHSAKEGRKLRALAAEPRAAFEMDGGHRLIEAERACGYGYAFESVVGSGRAALVSDPEEKRRALALLMRHQTGREFSFGDAEAAAVAVIRLEVERLSGKLHP